MIGYKIKIKKDNIKFTEWSEDLKKSVQKVKEIDVLIVCPANIDDNGNIKGITDREDLKKVINDIMPTIQSLRKGGKTIGVKIKVYKNTYLKVVIKPEDLEVSIHRKFLKEFITNVEVDLGYED